MIRLHYLHIVDLNLTHVYSNKKKQSEHVQVVTKCVTNVCHACLSILRSLNY